MTSWADVGSRRVGLYGLGREGNANLRACRARGVEPVLVDDAPSGDVDGLPVLSTDAGGLDALLDCDLVIKSPGISPYAAPVRRLVDAGVEVTGGLAMWFADADPARVVAVTGTKGKSTTCAVAAHLLRGYGYRVFLGGNFASPPQDPDSGEYDYWVVEVSSYQAHDVTRSPAVVGVTSLNPDHLQWHEGSADTYYRDKLRLCAQPGARVTVADGDSAELRVLADQLGPRVVWVDGSATADDAWVERLGLRGPHNEKNARIARALLIELGVPQATDLAATTAAAAGFEDLPNRLEVVHRVGEVEFVDDGLSTNVLSACAAVEAFTGRRIALIVGGADRGIDYRGLGEFLRGRAASVRVVTTPDNGARIASEVRAVTGGELDIVETAGLDEAVAVAHDWAAPDGVVLLSPAAPSFGRYKDYQDRGRAFLDAARTRTRT